MRRVISWSKAGAWDKVRPKDNIALKIGLKHIKLLVFKFAARKVGFFNGGTDRAPYKSLGSAPGVATKGNLAK